MTMTARVTSGVEEVDRLVSRLPNLHELGIEAHVLIYLSPDIGADEAIAKINSVCARPEFKENFRMVHLHTALGDIDLLADVFCQWTSMPGHETETIGKWVSDVRKLVSDSNGRPVVARTTTAVCMNMH